MLLGGAGFGDVADGRQDCDPMCRGARSAVRGDTEVERLSVVDGITTFIQAYQQRAELGSARTARGRGIRASAEFSSVP